MRVVWNYFLASSSQVSMIVCRCSGQALFYTLNLTSYMSYLIQIRFCSVRGTVRRLPAIRCIMGRRVATTIARCSMTHLDSLGTASADCTVVVPTYNERENIGALIERILELPRFRVLVVDDNSPDGTAAIVAQIARREPRVDLLSRPGKLGLGTAYIAGFRRALTEGASYIHAM